MFTSTSMRNRLPSSASVSRYTFGCMLIFVLTVKPRRSPMADTARVSSAMPVAVVIPTFAGVPPWWASVEVRDPSPSTAPART